MEVGSNMPSARDEEGSMTVLPPLEEPMETHNEDGNASTPVSPPLPPRRRNLSYGEKRQLIAQKEREPSWTQETLALWAKDAFALETKPTQATISNILRARDRLCAADVPAAFRAARPVKHPELDSTISAWVVDALAQGEPLTRDAIQQRAIAFAQELSPDTSITFSKGWVVSFMRRHQLHFRPHSGDGRNSAIAFVRQSTARRAASDVGSPVSPPAPLGSVLDSDGQMFPESSSASSSTVSDSSHSTTNREKRTTVPQLPPPHEQQSGPLYQPVPSPQPQLPPPTPAPLAKKRRQIRRSSPVLTPDKEKQQQLFALECRKLQVDIEAKQLQLTVEKTLARKKLLDAGIPAAELDKLIPM